MEIKKGIGVSPGVVIGTAVVLDAEDVVIPRRQVEPGTEAAEVERLNQAIDNAMTELGVLRERMSKVQAGQIAGIFDTHLSILKDKSVLKEITHEINANHASAEYAVSVVMRRYAQMFLGMSDRYL